MKRKIDYEIPCGLYAFLFACNFFREAYQELFTYFVPPSNETKWSKMFGLLESAKGSLQIEDYSIQQTSLEQVFIKMANSVSNQ